MGEKLSAFISFYSSKAKEEVEKWKTKVAEDEVKWKKLTEEIYPSALKTATDLKQVETFQQVFPSPGTFVENVTKYGTLLGVDTEFEKQLKELYKWRNTKTQIANRKNYLAQAEGYASKGGEDYISRLSHEIYSKAADASSRGAKFSSIIDSLFKSYPDYADFLEDLIDHIPGPDGVLTSAETYAALLEKKEAGAFTQSSEKTKPSAEPSGSSTLNESTTSAKAPDQSSSSINPPDNKKENPSTETKSPINTTTPSKSETTSTTTSEGGVTSKVGELQTENILETPPSQAINVNLEAKPAEAKPTSSTTNSKTVLNTSNSNTVNDVNSTSSVTSNPTSSMSNVGATSDKTIMKVENTNNQSSSNTVNEPPKEKEKSKFLSKVGNFAKKAGAALNLPSVAELGDQAKGLFGATASNISSRVSEVKESFAINSNNRESESSSQTSSSTNSVNSTKTAETNKLKILGESATGSSSNPANVLKTETQNSMTVEQKPPVVAMSSEPATNSTSQQTTTATTAVSNTANSQTSTQPQTTSNITQITQPAAQPAATQPGVGVNVDVNQLAQSIMRLERILISGIEVTIKDT